MTDPKMPAAPGADDAEWVRAACNAGAGDLACGYPECACRTVPKQIAALAPLRQAERDAAFREGAAAGRLAAASALDVRASTLPFTGFRDQREVTADCAAYLRGSPPPVQGHPDAE